MFDLVRPRRVLGCRNLSREAFVLTIERRRESVTAGCHVDVVLPDGELRPYSLFSGEADNVLEILVRRVTGGLVSTQLSFLQPGDGVRVGSPTGNFGLAPVGPGERVLLMATGTGIAPFRSFLRTRPDLDYILVHGVRDAEEDFGSEFALPSRRVFCVSGSSVPDYAFAGRVTQWLDQVEQPVYDHAYLCGNARMIFEVFPTLVDSGMDENRIHTETYF